MTDLPDNNGNGQGFSNWLGDWRKLLTYGLGAGAVLFGILSGFWKIDARLEQHGESIRALADSVKALADKSATLDVVDAKIEHACLRMQLLNQGRGWVCPFVSQDLKQATKLSPPQKHATKAPIPGSVSSFGK